MCKRSLLNFLSVSHLDCVFLFCTQNNEKSLCNVQNRLRFLRASFSSFCSRPVSMGKFGQPSSEVSDQPPKRFTTC